MIIEARPSTLAAPPMSFFISSMPLDGLMSRPPVSKQTPLPTSVTLGASLSPQTMSISRGASAEARPTAWIIGKFCVEELVALDHRDLGLVLCRKAAHGLLQRIRPHVVGRRVDQVAGQEDAVANTLDARRVGAFRQRDAK